MEHPLIPYTYEAQTERFRISVQTGLLREVLPQTKTNKLGCFLKKNFYAILFHREEGCDICKIGKDFAGRGNFFIVVFLIIITSVITNHSKQRHFIVTFSNIYCCTLLKSAIPHYPSPALMSFLPPLSWKC